MPPRNNFAGRDLYTPLDCAWLHRDAAEALASVSVHRLAAQRPVRACWCSMHCARNAWRRSAGRHCRARRWAIWRRRNGSIHSFGMAVDVTLIDADGAEFDMGTGFDDLSELSHPALEERFLAAGQLPTSSRSPIAPCSAPQ